MAINSGNPNPPNNAGGTWDGTECPLCGVKVKRLPDHLPECEGHD